MTETNNAPSSEKQDYCVILGFYTLLYDFWLQLYPEAPSSQTDPITFSKSLTNLQKALERIETSVPELPQETFYAIAHDHNRVVYLVSQHALCSPERQQIFLQQHAEEKDYLGRLVNQYLEIVRETPKTPP